jgi:hypothetical protein
MSTPIEELERVMPTGKEFYVADAVKALKAVVLDQQKRIDELEADIRELRAQSGK